MEFQRKSDECDNCDKTAHEWCCSHMCNDCCKDPACVIHSKYIKISCYGCKMRMETKNCTDHMCTVCCANYDCPVHKHDRDTCRNGYCGRLVIDGCPYCNKCCTSNFCGIHNIVKPSNQCIICNKTVEPGYNRCDDCNKILKNCSYCNNRMNPTICHNKRCEICCRFENCELHSKSDMCIFCEKYPADAVCSISMCNECCYDDDCIFHNVTTQKNLMKQQAAYLMATKPRCDFCQNMAANRNCIRKRCSSCCSGFGCKVHSIAEVDDSRPALYDKCMSCTNLANRLCINNMCTVCCGGLNCSVHGSDVSLSPKQIKCLSCAVNFASRTCLHNLCGNCCKDDKCLSHKGRKSVTSVVPYTAPNINKFSHDTSEEAHIFFQIQLMEAMESSRKEAEKQGLILTDVEEPELISTDLEDEYNVEKELERFRLEMIDEIYSKKKENKQLKDQIIKLEKKEEEKEEEENKVRLDGARMREIFSKMKQVVKEEK